MILIVFYSNKRHLIMFFLQNEHGFVVSSFCHSNPCASVALLGQYKTTIFASSLSISYIVLLFINAQVMLLGRLMIFYLFTLYVLLINCIYITPACQGSAKAGIYMTTRRRYISYSNLKTAAFRLNSLILGYEPWNSYTFMAIYDS